MISLYKVHGPLILALPGSEAEFMGKCLEKSWDVVEKIFVIPIIVTLPKFLPDVFAQV